ncbi:MarR family winged helix-turn-helix transcriptional regulator [Microbacterium sp.]|uniref:MarR family winged helix-turn-helix transcriptional regulator n=1 Tax=Microbacterium sp. TaxID=51671 RepID=UPI002E334A0C|nr:MarR family winged helix-turn-helix transcriptional regulator [Microbacterium sp.]HEX5730780.1 MarR family winged helix-turn-helix transcriptional regulator [Microbacterium sp.]
MAAEARSTTSEVARADERLRNSALTDDLSFLLARANALSLAAGNAALAQQGLRVRSYSVLALAVDDTRPSQRDLATFLRLDPSQVVALVDDLQGRGLVRREADPADRRTNVVVATAEGRALFAAAQRAARQAERALHDVITPEQRRTLGELLRLLAFPD